MAGDLPSTTHPHLACGKIVAGRWLREKRRSSLGSPSPVPGAWHPFRLQVASERRDLPDAAIMAVTGWRSVRVIPESYRHADGARMLTVLDPAGSRPRAPEPGTDSAPAKAK